MIEKLEKLKQLQHSRMKRVTERECLKGAIIHGNTKNPHQHFIEPDDECKGGVFKVSEG